MGIACDYGCPDCRYGVEFMVSGYSCGMSSHVHGVLCTDCRELRISPLPGHPADLPDDPEEMEAVIGSLTLTCPESPSHNVLPWADPGPCPRCGATLQRGEGLILWD